MSEKRFTFYYERGNEVVIEDNGQMISTKECVNKLNEQQDTIITLRRRLEKINGGYGHLTHRNGLTANEWVIESQERELQKKNEQISDWIEQHSKDIEKISEQQANISDLKDENEQLQQIMQEVCELLAEAIDLFSDSTIYLIPAIEKAIKLLKGGIDE